MATDITQDRKFQQWMSLVKALQSMREDLVTSVSDLAKIYYENMMKELEDELGIHPDCSCQSVFTLPVTQHPVLKCKSHTITDAKCHDCVVIKIAIKIKNDHRYLPKWNNTNPSKWTSNSWDIMKCFMSVGGYFSVRFIEKTDFSGLLSILINNMKTFELLNIVDDASKNKLNCLKEVQNIRNKLYHTPIEFLDEKERPRFFWYLKKLMQILGTYKSFSKLDELENGQLDIFLTKFKQFQEKMEHHEYLNSKELRYWNEENKYYCETRAGVEGFNKAKIYSFLIVTGCSGSGKTTLVRNIAFGLKREMGYLIEAKIPNGLTDIMFYNKPNENQVFVMDDPFGVYELLEANIYDWKQNIKDLKELFLKNRTEKNGKLKLLISCRLSIVNSKDVNEVLKLLENDICYLPLQELPLNVVEKVSIFEKYNSKVKINLFFKKRPDFPFVCSLCKNKCTEEVKKIFESPLTYMIDEFNHMRLKRSSVNHNFLCILLCSIFDGQVMFSWLDPVNKKHDQFINEKRIIKKVLKQFNLVFDSGDIKDICDTFKSMGGSYFTIREKKVFFIHDQMKDAATTFCAEKHIKLFLKHATLNTIAKQFLFSSPTDISKEHYFVPCLVLEKCWWNEYCQRIVTDLTNQEILSLSSNSNLENSDFQKQLLESLKKSNCDRDLKSCIHKHYPRLEKSLSKLCNWKDYVEYFLNLGLNINILCTYVCEQGNMDYAKYLSDRCSDNNYVNLEGKTALQLASSNGQLNITSLLIHDGSDVLMCDNDGNSPLWLASKNGYINIVSFLIKHGADLLYCNKDGLSPLAIASANGHLEIVDCLLNNGGDLLVCNDGRYSPLWVASSHGHSNVVSLLLKQGCSVLGCNIFGTSPLAVAAAKEHLEVANILLQHVADVSVFDYDRHSPLCLAVANEHKNVVSCLIKLNADVSKCIIFGQSKLQSLINTLPLPDRQLLVDFLLSLGCDFCNNERRSPLWFASSIGYEDAESFLIKHGSDVLCCDEYGISPLAVAVAEKYLETANNKLQQGANVSMCDDEGHSPLLFATDRLRYDIPFYEVPCSVYSKYWYKYRKSPLTTIAEKTNAVSFLIKNGCDVSGCDKNGTSSLAVASKEGNLKIVKILLHHGADVLMCNERGCTPLWLASAKGHIDVVSCLIKHGADVSKCNISGESALAHASAKGRLKIVDCLLNNGDDLFVYDDERHSPFWEALAYGCNHVVTFLIKHNFDLLDCNKDGLSALAVASKTGNLELVKFLFYHGADVLVCNNRGCSPLWLAAANGHKNIVFFLIKHGADVASDCDENGTSSLAVASGNGNLEIVNILLNYGSFILMCDKRGCSPLWLASAKGNKDIVSLLIKYGADCLGCDNTGVSPLAVASKNGHWKVVFTLLCHGANPSICEQHSPKWLALNYYFY